jgi:hypothetical protein
MTHNTIGKGSHHRAINGGNDAYFTKPEIAEKFSLLVQSLYPDARFIEPSAGNGSFSRHFQSITAYDLHPKNENIIKADWFTVVVPENSVVIGNPPFGFAASLAIRFFNHASNAKAICFIVPRSFQKASVHRRLNLSFHLVYEEVLPKNAFMLDGKEYSVPCVFQIWEKQKELRKISPVSSENPIVEFCDKSSATHAIRRVGGRAGELLSGTDYSESTTFFIKLKKRNALKIISALQPTILQMRNQTAGVRSISKNELAALFNAYSIGKSNA